MCLRNRFDENFPEVTISTLRGTRIDICTAIPCGPLIVDFDARLIYELRTKSTQPGVDSICFRSHACQRYRRLPDLDEPSLQAGTSPEAISINFRIFWLGTSAFVPND